VKTLADVGIEIPYNRSGEVDTVCPECSHTRKKSRQKCLSVNIDEGTWFCHHCGWKGTIKEGGLPPHQRVNKTYVIPAPPPESVIPKVVVEWFKNERGIDEWVLQDAHITAGAEFCHAQGKTVMTMRFPYYRDGKLVNIKYRARPKDFWTTGGAEMCLYGYDDIKGQPIFILVEGEIDKLTIDQMQAYPCASVPNGTGSSLDFLQSGATERIFAEAEQVYIAVDMDEAGRKLADELARRIGHKKCKRVSWPQGCKDANETLLATGKTGVLDAIMDAEPYPVEGIITMRATKQQFLSLYRNGYDHGKRMGLGDLDEIYRPRPGLLTVVTGIPGHGKSRVIDNFMVRLAKGYGWRFGVCSPESQPTERYWAGLAAIYVGKPFEKDYVNRMSEREAEEAATWIGDHFTSVLPEEPTIECVLDRLDTLVYRNGILGAVIDPWNELDHSRPPSMSETEYTGHVLRTMKQWAMRTGVCLWLVAHPTKLTKKEDGTYPVPDLYNVSGSSNFFNKPDAGLTVWRDIEQPNAPTIVKVTKVRWGEVTKYGESYFTYDPATGIISQ
jgi:twinkle protein